MAQLRPAIQMLQRFRVGLAMGMALLVSACAPVKQGAIRGGEKVMPGFEGEIFTSFDGARLGLNVWEPAREAVESSGPDAGGDPEEEVVILAVHGMNDYAGTFNAAGPWWAAHGATVYAYDQRGFGRSPKPGIWPEADVMREDLRTAVKVVRARHPGAKLAVVGESMGAAVSITTFGSDAPPEADALILSAPGLRGWGALPVLYKASLWTSAHVRPSWVVVPPKGVSVTPTDNIEKQREMWNDPNVLKETRIDAVYGVVSMMEDADTAVPKLPERVPTLLLYGAKDEVIPPRGVERAAKRLPDHVRTAYYENGYHMLMNDLQAETVWRDVLSFIRAPGSDLPSNAPPLPWKD